MPASLYRATAEFFRVLGHPVRIRVLELLCEGPKPVRDLLADAEIESVAVTASSLSQQLAVLRRHGMVRTTREGGSVVYALAGPDVTDLMKAARRILAEMHAGGHGLFLRIAGLEEADVAGTAG
ncbi:MAG TPA: metalloregulator ArsR/SmtB family transcription factor [Actinospica sp.]|jgi:ArsR family transcriptional regulator|nr:metalloregulator ArsR/SmtB family transcription factor [Actinospica sp.]